MQEAKPKSTESQTPNPRPKKPDKHPVLALNDRHKKKPHNTLQRPLKSPINPSDYKPYIIQL